MLRLVISPRATADLESIADWIANDHPRAAVEAVQELLDVMHLLRTNPAIGHPREELADESLLTWPVGKIIVIYRTTQAELQVVAVISGYRNLTALDF